MSNRALPWLALACLVLLGCWAYVPHLSEVPIAADAEKWLFRTTPRDPDSLSYVFGSRHFVGYRPTAALSFWLSHHLWGWNWTAHRTVDLALHALGAVGTWWVARRLFDSPWAALIAPAVVLLHPAAETVVPHLARRSYSLAWVLGVWGLLGWIAGVQRRSVALTVLGIAGVLAGAHANESGYALAVVAPLVGLAVATDPDKLGLARRAAALTAALTAGFLGLRYAILGRIGGYHRLFVAWFDGERPRLMEAPEPRHLEIAQQAVKYVVAPFDPDGLEALLPAWAAGLLLAVAVAGGVLSLGRRERLLTAAL